VYSDDGLSRIYDRTSSYWHICRKKLSFTNYGRYGCRGAWEVEHSIARANGGSNHGNNLYAACMSCNRGKGVGTTRSARAAHGRT
jgi:5-methylcytosine-specific restriction endonuclease McrA